MDIEDIFQTYRWRPEFDGVALDGPDTHDALGDTLLHYAASQGNLEHIETLIRLGADIDRPGDIGNTPIQCAAMRGQRSAVKVLLAAGADPTKANEFGDTALSWARACKQDAVVDLICGWTDDRRFDLNNR